MAQQLTYITATNTTYTKYNLYKVQFTKKYKACWKKMDN